MIVIFLMEKEKHDSNIRHDNILNEKKKNMNAI